MYYGNVNKPLNLNLDRTAKIPLAEQIRRGVTKAIEGGVLEPGARFPSWQDLAAELGVARGTVRTAYEKLAAAQLIEASRATGTRVAQRPRAVVKSEQPPDMLGDRRLPFAVVPLIAQIIREKGFSHGGSLGRPHAFT